MKISKEHGLNPSVSACAVCSQEIGLILFGKLKDDAEAPRRVLDNEPCENCQKDIEEHKKKGIVIFIISDSYKEKGSPFQHYLGLVVVKEEACKKMFKDVSLEKRMLFCPEFIARQIGLFPIPKI